MRRPRRLPRRRRRRSSSCPRRARRTSAPATSASAARRAASRSCKRDVLPQLGALLLQRPGALQRRAQPALGTPVLRAALPRTTTSRASSRRSGSTASSATASTWSGSPATSGTRCRRRLAAELRRLTAGMRPLLPHARRARQVALTISGAASSRGRCGADGGSALRDELAQLARAAALAPGSGSAAIMLHDAACARIPSRSSSTGFGKLAPRTARTGPGSGARQRPVRTVCSGGFSIAPRGRRPRRPPAAAARSRRRAG